MQIMWKYRYLFTGRSINVHKSWFFTSFCSGYLPSSYDLEETDADQIIQMVSEEVTLTNKEMQVIMQSDNKHPHITSQVPFLDKVF